MRKVLEKWITIKYNLLNDSTLSTFVTTFGSCIIKINNMFVNKAEDLGIVMPAYNLLEYSDNYSMT